MKTVRTFLKISNRRWWPGWLVCVFALTATQATWAQKSIAREWNEVLLEAIRNDLAKPTVHARNLFHSAVAMYDGWALFDKRAETVFLGQEFGGYPCVFNGIPLPDNINEARRQLISYALYRLLTHRFQKSPGGDETISSFDQLMRANGYDPSFDSEDYSGGSYAALGNYLGNQLIVFGQRDGANEQDDYANLLYRPVNPPLVLAEYQNNSDIDPNRWQPLSFDLFVDQAGNTVPVAIPPFLGPEWGEVIPFALNQDERRTVNNGFDTYLYEDPGQPPMIQDSASDGFDDPYKWHFSLVAAWSAHHDPNDTTRIDISPGSLGNISVEAYPEDFETYRQFYNYSEGGAIGSGHSINPATGRRYASNWVKRSDYTRVLAEFWADGPDSETPPGHWFTILNYVSDHPEFTRRLAGSGLPLTDLEWDVKAYLALGGAMHDAAIATWAVKGYYDYVRPISAIRYMSARGQSSDPSLPNYDPHGIPLRPGLIQLISEDDPLAATNVENVGQIKIYGWRGPDYIDGPLTDTAGVGWILGTRWWPYQRGTFVTPPFAGYVSGHSTFSSAAAEVLTLLTGDSFFPGGMGTFEVEANNYLVFENGPSESFSLQWATYRDASDQSSLSRIWGGIHPPIDDIPGRLIGIKVGKSAFEKALDLFQPFEDPASSKTKEVAFAPSPFDVDLQMVTSFDGPCVLQVFNLNGAKVLELPVALSDFSASLTLETLTSGMYVLKLFDMNEQLLHEQKILKR